MKSPQHLGFHSDFSATSASVITSYLVEWDMSPTFSDPTYGRSAPLFSYEHSTC